MREFARTVADHMEAGFLENIVDMLKRDTRCFGLIPSLINDERQRVRIGALVLVETFLGKDRARITGLIPSISGALKNENPIVRADAAYMLSIIGDKSAVAFLESSLADAHPAVREAAREAIEEISQKK